MEKLSGKTISIIFHIMVIQTSVLVALLFFRETKWVYYPILVATGISIILCVLLFLSIKLTPNTKPKLSAIEETMNLADMTFPYFRQGLDSESAMIIVKIIKSISNIPAVAITDRKNVLAFIGEGCEHHPPGYPIRTQLTLDAIKDGKMRIVTNKTEFNCKVEGCVCPLESVIIVPLFNRTNVTGCLKFYYVKKDSLSDEQIKLALGMGKLLSMQIQLADFDRQKQLATEAKLDALQTQVNPHFLFNTLNTINMYTHKDPEYASKLIVRLSILLRYLLGNNSRFVPLRKEIYQLKNYVMIEKARFKDKLSVHFDFDSDIDNIEVPVLSIQPLVNNSIIHGILPKETEGKIDISGKRNSDDFVITVSDDGVGIKEEDLANIFTPGFGRGCGIGLSNVDDRLKLLYGESYGLHVESIYAKGTTVSFRVPIHQKK